jgi:beta-galactosidase
MTGVGVRGDWVRAGLDRLEPERSRRRDARVTSWRPPGGGPPIVHTQRVTIDGGVVRVSERVDMPDCYDDLARVGVAFGLPAGFEQLAWLGLGPHETYPDRCRAEVGRWRSTVGDQYVDSVFPQHHGSHHDTRWFALGRDAGRSTRWLRFDADRPFGFTALHHSVADLTAARHTTDLTAREETFVHLDIAHRGLGTASCGPDILPAYRVGPGRYRWLWSVTPVARP